MGDVVEMPLGVRALSESLARELETDRGRWSCELVFEDGRLVKVYLRHGPITAREIDVRFPPT